MPSNVFNSAGAQARGQLRRQWLRGVWGNPLARSADRWQSGLRIVLISLWALALPLAATVSSVLSANGLQAIDQSAGNQTPTSALLLADAPTMMVFSDSVTPAIVDKVQASWVAADGTARSGPISAAPGLPAGSRTGIWIDRSGAQVSAPERPSGAVWNGIAVGGGIWLAFGCVLAMVYWLSARGLNRGRSADWDREWLKLAAH